MAGERIGKTYEAILKVVLERLKKKGVIHDNIFWNQIPDIISVEPDFSIGTDKNHPTVYLMVTHSGSSKNSDMKCWRNLGELCEAKVSLNPTPKAINIVFEGAIKATLKELQNAAFDGQIIVSDSEYGKALQKWVHKNEPNLPTEQEEKATVIDALSLRDSTLLKLLTDLEVDLQNALQSHNDALAQLWEIEKSRTRSTPPDSRMTYLRRGISKLFIFPDIDIAIKLYKGKKVAPGQLPDYIYSIGLAKKVIGKAAPCDIEIQGAIDLIEESQIRDLYHSMDNNEIVQGWVAQLRDIPTMEFIGGYVSDNYASLCDKDFLYQAILQLHDNPKALIAEGCFPTNWPPSNVWIVPYLMEVIKTYSGKANGYGIAQLAADVVSLGYGSSDDLSSASQFGGGFLNVWLNRNPSPFRLDLIEGVAAALSMRLFEIGLVKCRKLISTKAVEKTIINNLIEAKLCTYRMFEPLYLLMQQKIPTIRQEKIRTCFAEKADLGGQTGKTTVAIVKNTLINWQTATDSGRDHKRKELCGRAVGLRYMWDNDQQRFISRSGIKKLILLVDGTWRQKDLEALSKSGWDEIYYPDEIDELKKAIV